MSREELNKLIMQACERTWNEKTCKEIEQALSQEPCTDNVSEKEQKPCKYCDEDGFCLTQNLCISQRTICNKYYAEQEPCADAVSRKDVINAIDKWITEYKPQHYLIQSIRELPSVNPQYTGNEFFNFDAPIVKKSMEQDAISRQAVLDLVNSDWKYEGLETDVASLPPVTQKSGKWDRLYNWLNDMRLGITPDETDDDIDERHCREAQTDILDEIMEWMIKAERKEV